MPEPRTATREHRWAERLQAEFLEACLRIECSRFDGEAMR